LIRRGEKDLGRAEERFRMKGCNNVQYLKNKTGKTDSKKYNRKGEEVVGSQERKNRQ